MSQNDSKNLTLILKNEIFLPEICKLLNEGKSVIIKLKGYSMRPFLEDNRDKAILKKTDDIRKGDIVLAETYKNHFVLHRILKIQGTQVILLGDGNLRTEMCTTDDIRAKAIGFYRKGGRKIERNEDLKWRIYTAVWMRLIPIRRYLLAILRRTVFSFH